MRASNYAASLIVAALMFTGCSSHQELKPSGQGEARAAAKATQNALHMSLATDPEKPAEEKPFTLRIHVADQAGKAVAGAALHGVFTMTTMDHGKKEFDFASKGGGDYEASTKAEMEGPWEVKVTAKHDADMGEQTFPVAIGAK